jgi:hypothetical protein
LPRYQIRQVGDFDAHRRVVLTLAESVDGASPSRVKELVGLLVEIVSVHDRRADPEQIVWAAAARPFFDDRLAAAAGLRRPRRESRAH